MKENWTLKKTPAVFPAHEGGNGRVDPKWLPTVHEHVIEAESPY